MAPQPTDTFKDPKTGLIVALFNLRNVSVPHFDAAMRALDVLVERELWQCAAASPDTVLKAQGRVAMVSEIRDTMKNCHAKYKELFP